MNNVEIARLISERVVNGGDFAPVSRYIAEDYVYHGLGGMTARGPEGFAGAIREFRVAIPDLRSEILDVVADEDRVVLRFNFTGTHKGVFLGHAPTNAALRFEGMIMRRFRDGQVVEDWDFFDLPTVFAQMSRARGVK